MTSLPKHARAVVIGGGIMGCSTAYHLAKLGWREVVILERASLTSGSTFHAAGLVGQLRTSASITRLLKYSVELYATLEQETGHATGWKQNGGLRLACNAERWTEVRRQATTAHSFGLEMHLLSPQEARALWPLMEVGDLVGAAFLPTDGQVNPSDLAVSLATGARQRGVRVVEDCPVEAILIERGRAVGVRTALGEIRCEVVVNCAGMWARELGALAGVSVPVQAIKHQFLVTEPIDGITPNLPTLRDPDRLVYFKEEVGGLVMGGYEPNPIPWAIDGVPRDWTFKLLEPDWEHFEPLAAQAVQRVPALEQAGARQLVHGPEAFTPDGSFILGEAPELAGFFVGAGFNAYGIAACGGAGRALAEWIDAGEASSDLWPVDIRRFGGHHRDAAWTHRRTLEAYARHYTMAWPHEEHEAGRPVHTSPLYERLVARGAVFGEKLGWERPNWFAPRGTRAHDVYTYGRPNWFDAVGEEHRAAREAVALFDETSFAKFELRGRDAERALSWLCSNDVARPVGSVVYTPLLNRRGGIECDLTVARLADDRFYVVTGTACRTHDADWIRRHVPDRLEVELDDVTMSRAVLGVMGPRARAVLAAACDADLSDAAFPFLSWRELTIAGVRVRALRVTFVGELGWELHVPRDGAAAVYERLWRVGGSHGMRDAGYRAIDSLRLEKGYRVWGRDITPDDTPLEAGLGFAVKLRGDVAFLGREALEAQRRAGVRKRFCGFTVAPEVVLLGRETILRDGEKVGWLTSGGFGYTIGRGIGWGYVRHPRAGERDFVASGRYELEVAGEPVPCEVCLEAPYDPRGERVRGQARVVQGG